MKTNYNPIECQVQLGFLAPQPPSSDAYGPNIIPALVTNLAIKIHTFS